jgi:hypothetical protein
MNRIIWLALRHSAIILSASFASSVAGFNQATAQVEGRVIDLFSKPVQGATVSIQGLRFSAQTDENGTYVLDYVPGKIVITVSKEGYKPASEGGSLDLTVATLTRVPVDDLVLVRLPPAPSLFLVGDELGSVRFRTIKRPKKRRNPPVAEVE